MQFAELLLAGLPELSSHISFDNSQKTCSIYVWSMLNKCFDFLVRINNNFVKIICNFLVDIEVLLAFFIA